LPFNYSKNMAEKNYFAGTEKRKGISEKEIKDFIHNKEKLNPKERYEKALTLFDFSRGLTRDDFYSTLQWYLVKDYGLYERIHTKLGKDKSEIHSLSLDTMEQLFSEYVLDHMSYSFRGKEYTDILGFIDSEELVIRTHEEHSKRHGIKHDLDFKKQSEQIIKDKENNRMTAIRAMEITSDYLKELGEVYEGLCLSIFLQNDLKSPIKKIVDFHGKILENTAFKDQSNIINKRDILTIEQRLFLIGKVKFWIENGKSEPFKSKTGLENYMKTISLENTEKYKEQTIREFESGIKEELVVVSKTYESELIEEIIEEEIIDTTKSIKAEVNKEKMLENINTEIENLPLHAFCIMKPSDSCSDNTDKFETSIDRIVISIREEGHTRGRLISVRLDQKSSPISCGNQKILFKDICGNDYSLGEVGSISAALIYSPEITKIINEPENLISFARFLKKCRFIVHSGKDYTLENLSSRKKGRSYLCTLKKRKSSSQNYSLNQGRINKMDKFYPFEKSVIENIASKIENIYEAPLLDFYKSVVRINELYQLKNAYQVESINNFVSELCSSKKKTPSIKPKTKSKSKSKEIVNEAEKEQPNENINQEDEIVKLELKSESLALLENSKLMSAKQMLRKRCLDAYAKKQISEKEFKDILQAI